VAGVSPRRLRLFQHCPPGDGVTDRVRHGVKSMAKMNILKGSRSVNSAVTIPRGAAPTSQDAVSSWFCSLCLLYQLSSAPDPYSLSEVFRQ